MALQTNSSDLIERSNDRIILTKIELEFEYRELILFRPYYSRPYSVEPEVTALVCLVDGMRIII